MNISDLDYLEVISSETENALAGGRRYYFKNEDKYVDSDKTMNLEFGDIEEKDNSYNSWFDEADTNNFSSKDLNRFEDFGQRNNYRPKPGMRGSGSSSFSISYWYRY